VPAFESVFGRPLEMGVSVDFKAVPDDALRGDVSLPLSGTALLTP